LFVNEGNEDGLDGRNEGEMLCIGGNSEEQISQKIWWRQELNSGHLDP
jgi:hypothetical protein